MISLEVNGVRYSGFLTASIELRLDALAAVFKFEATSEDGIPLPFKGGEACKVYADDELVSTGFIEIVKVEGDSESHKIEVEGRDKTCDLIDTTLGGLGFDGQSPVSDIRGNFSLKRVCEIIIKHLGIDMDVIDKANPKNFDDSDWISPEIGQETFDFLEKLARKRQVFLGRDANGNLVLTKGVARVTKAFVRHRKNEPSSNVISYTVGYDLTARFRDYQSVSQYNLTAVAKQGSGAAAGIIASQGNTDQDRISDLTILRPRQLIIAGESMFSSTEDRDRAVWERDVRRARGQVYGATVDGYRDQEGNLWELNTVVTVDDVDAGIENIAMLVNSIEFNLADDTGSTTTLGLVSKDSYTLEAADPTEEELGLGLFG